MAFRQFIMLANEPSKVKQLSWKVSVSH